MCSSSTRFLSTLLGIGSFTLSALTCSAQTTNKGEAHPSAYGGSPIYQQNNTLYPAEELRALPPARAAAVATDAIARRTQSDLNLTLNELRRAAANSPDLLEAVAEEQAAWDELRLAREQALTDVRSDPAYQAALELRVRLAEQLEQTRRNPDATPAQIRALAEAKLARATLISSMEAAAIGSSTAVRDARARLMIAGDRVAVLRRQLDDEVRRSTEVRELRKSAQDTKIAAVAADAYLAEARNVAQIALGYAYDVQRYPRPYVVNGPYPWYGDGYSSTIVTGGYPIGYPISWNQPMARP